MQSKINGTINLYADVGWKKWFSKWRFRNAPYIEVEKNIAKKGRIIELGCGEGIFSNYVALSSSKREVIGYELNEERIKEADRGLPNAKFKKADVTKLSLPKADTVVLFHVLHHLTSYKKQEELLQEIARLLKKGKKLVIVEVNMKFSLKFIVASLFDYFIVPVVFEKKLNDKIYFRKSEDWVRYIRNLGFSVKSKEVDRGMVFPHLILYCTKLHNS